jgi:hypothetical protein
MMKSPLSYNVAQQGHEFKVVLFYLLHQLVAASVSWEKFNILGYFGPFSSRSRIDMTTWLPLA